MGTAESYVRFADDCTCQYSERADLTEETLEKQYEVVKKRTSNNYTYNMGSHVMQFGSLAIDEEPAADYLGNLNTGMHHISIHLSVGNLYGCEFIPSMMPFASNLKCSKVSLLNRWHGAGSCSASCCYFTRAAQATVDKCYLSANCRYRGSTK